MSLTLPKPKPVAEPAPFRWKRMGAHPPASQPWTSSEGPLRLIHAVNVTVSVFNAGAGMETVPAAGSSVLWPSQPLMVRALLPAPKPSRTCCSRPSPLKVNYVVPRPVDSTCASCDALPGW